MFQEILEVLVFKVQILMYSTALTVIWAAVVLQYSVLLWFCFQ